MFCHDFLVGYRRYYVSQVLMLYLPKTPHCWTHNRIIDHWECLELKVKEQSQAFLSFFRAFMTNFAWTVSSLRIQGAFTTLHHQSHTTPTQSLTWVFSVVRWGYSGLWLHFPFRHFLHRRQILYHVSPGERPCELPPHALGTPQASTICIALNLVGHWSLTSGQGLRIIFAELKRRSHWVDVSIINQRRISPKQCLPCWEKGAHVSEASTSSHYFIQPSAPHCPPTVLMTSSKNSKTPQNVQVSTIMINIMLSLWSIMYLSLSLMEMVYGWEERISYACVFVFVFVFALFFVFVFRCLYFSCKTLQRFVMIFTSPPPLVYTKRRLQATVEYTRVPLCSNKGDFFDKTVKTESFATFCCEFY